MLLLGAALIGGQSVARADGLNIVCTPHSSASISFWQAG
jgi:simple sugar transport system substrate-binding protein